MPGPRAATASSSSASPGSLAVGEPAPDSGQAAPGAWSSGQGQAGPSSRASTDAAVQPSPPPAFVGDGPLPGPTDTPVGAFGRQP